MRPITIHNVHTHVFTLRNIPKRFLMRGLVDIFKRKVPAKIAAWILRNIIPFNHSDKPQRMAVFAEAAIHNTQEDIFKQLVGFYPPGSRFGIMSMDFDYMGAGKPEKDFMSQLEELAVLKSNHGDQVVPFIAIDPRREGITELVKEYINEHQFGGIKLYPPLGYFPFDERLFDIYAFAEERGIPITAHCSPSGVHWQGRKKEEWRTHPRTGEQLKARSKRKFTDYFTHPANYYWVLDKFPNLKICFAHFGGAPEWDKFLDVSWPLRKQLPKENIKEERFVSRQDVSWLAVIIDLIRTPLYPNIYTDISYTAYKPRYLPLIKILVNNDKLRNFILYGSDYYMVLMDESERAFSITVRGFLGEDDYRQIAETNPKKFFQFNSHKE
ncbi:MAG: amidohydrolase family protein [Anaerolineae bacterium]|nr:amidohydrolase family protein [Anaerolineae bacterium]MDK1117172.1 amidohydrolase family protein [Anaerolineae bacterium]